MFLHVSTTSNLLLSALWDELLEEILQHGCRRFPGVNQTVRFICLKSSLSVFAPWCEERVCSHAFECPQITGVAGSCELRDQSSVDQFHSTCAHKCEPVR